MNDETGKDLERSSGGLIEVLSRQFPRETEENLIAGVPAQIPTEDLPNTSREPAKFSPTLKPTDTIIINGYKQNCNNIEALKVIPY
jgi:hypothetical protein